MPPHVKDDPCRAVVAPDKFKGTFTAPEVAGALARGLRGLGLQVTELPVADGGDGTASVLLAALGGEQRSARVHDALGRPCVGVFALLPDGTAVVDAASASGLTLLAEHERDPVAATSRGTGELIAHAAAAGAERVLVAAGGTATVDGGAGAIEALDEAGVSVRIAVLCDVRTRWEDAARVFGPQKGATQQAVAELERRLDDLAARAPRDPRRLAHGGCGGGLSGGLWAYRDAELLPGAEFVLQALRLDERLAHTVLAVTGEGGLDASTAEGKLVAAVSARCRDAGVPCHAAVGTNALDPKSWRALGLVSVIEAPTLAALERVGPIVAAGCFQ